MSTLVLFGRPASGKGTLSQHLSDACGYRACSTGEAMRAWAAGPTAEQAALRATMARGDYGSDELAVRIVRTFIDTLPDHVPGVILGHRLAIRPTSATIGGRAARCRVWWRGEAWPPS